MGMSWMRPVAVVAAVAAGVVAGSTAVRGGDATATSGVLGSREQSSLDIGGCAIRLDPAGPRIHTNTAHTCVGVKDVRITPGGRLRVDYLGAARTVSLMADADETLVSRSIQVGADAAPAYATFTLYDGRLQRTLDLRDPADYVRVTGERSNVWFGSVRDAS